MISVGTEEDGGDNDQVVVNNDEPARVEYNTGDQLQGSKVRKDHIVVEVKQVTTVDCGVVVGVGLVQKLSLPQWGPRPVFDPVGSSIRKKCSLKLRVRNMAQVRFVMK